MSWPHLVFYVNSLPAGVGGQSRGPVILIDPKYRGDEGIYLHELEHVRQWWLAGILASLVIYMLLVCPLFANGAIAALLTALAVPPEQCTALALLGFVAHPLLYLFWRRYRLWAELRAYKEQMRHPALDGKPMTALAAAHRLAHPNYKFDITPAQALALLTD